MHRSGSPTGQTPLQQMGVLDTEHGLVTAFSRDGDLGNGQGGKGVGSVGLLAESAAAGGGGNAVGVGNGNNISSSKKVYVTHSLRECGVWLWPLLSVVERCCGVCVWVRREDACRRVGCVAGSWQGEFRSSSVVYEAA